METAVRCHVLQGAGKGRQAAGNAGTDVMVIIDPGGGRGQLYVRRIFVLPL